jgi:hypothetical protein
MNNRPLTAKTPAGGRGRSNFQVSVNPSAAFKSAVLLMTLLFVGCADVVVVARNTVIGTWSQTGTLQVVVGGSETVTLAFTTDDGKPATNFHVTQGTMPVGWSAINAPLSCAQVSTGGGCVLALRYTPIAAATGTLTIVFEFVDDEGKTQFGQATLAYHASTHDNVVATVTPVGQITVIVGGKQSVTVQFTTDDGAQATNLQLRGLASLPAGWSSSAPTLLCAAVSTGNGCQLPLTFAPTTLGSGTLVLNFTYTDDAGRAQSGSVDVPYLATNDNNVIATPDPAGQIAAVVGGRNVAVAIGFTTDDGNAATNLQITAGLSALPAGWAGPTSFTCATVDLGNGCTLNLNYSPTAVASSTIVFSYRYTSAGGTAKTGTVSIPYVATADNNVVATAAPSGQIDTVVGGSGKTVTVTFTTDDGNLARNLLITSDLGNLPAGWSFPAAPNPPAFGCATLATGSGCQLTLLFAPTSVVSGTLQLAFSYNSNAGAAKTGTASLQYSSTTHNRLLATVSPSGQVTAEVNEGTQIATITFTSDDGNPVTNVAITGGLTSLPTDWTGPASFSCASAASGNACALPLQFQPLSASDNGTISLDYSYVDNAGGAQTGSVDVPYASVPTYFYVNGESGNVLRCAASFTDGSLSGCVPVATGFGAPYGIVFNGNTAYVADDVAGTVNMCPVNIDGTWGACTVATPAGNNPFTSPRAMAIYGGEMFVVDANGATPVTACSIDGDGTLSGCFTTGWSAPLNVPDGISVATATDGNAYAYIVDINGGNLTTCSVAVDDELLNCTQSAIGQNPAGDAAFNGSVYVATGDDADSVKRCPINSDGSITASNCVITALSANFAQAVGFGFDNGYAYISGYGGLGGVGGVFVCPITLATGNLDSCVLSSDPALEFQNLFGLASH